MPVRYNDTNSKCIARLEDAHLNERVVVVGSGPSSFLVPSIEELKSRLCKNCKIRPLRKVAEQFWGLCERAYKKNPKSYYRTIRKAFEDPPHGAPVIYKHIVNIRFRGFVTLNYDPFLPSAFREAHPQSYEKHFSAFSDAQDHHSAMELLNTPPRLVAIHGYCNPDNPNWEKQLILRTGDYERHYAGTGRQLFRWWVDLLLGTSCLFVGTSLQEPGIAQVLKYLQKEDLEKLLGQKHLHLKAGRDVGSSNLDPDLRRAFSVVEPIFYDPKDDNFSGLEEVLHPFSGVPTGRPKPRVAPTHSIAITDEFLG